MADTYTILADGPQPNAASVAQTFGDSRRLLAHFTGGQVPEAYRAKSSPVALTADYSSLALTLAVSAVSGPARRCTLRCAVEAYLPNGYGRSWQVVHTFEPVTETTWGVPRRGVVAGVFDGTAGCQLRASWFWSYGDAELPSTVFSFGISADALPETP